MADGRCPNCGYEYDVFERACPHCDRPPDESAAPGSALPEAKPAPAPASRAPRANPRLRTCRACGASAYWTEARCPSCGRPLSRPTNRWILVWAAAVLVLAAVALVAGLTGTAAYRGFQARSDEDAESRVPVPGVRDALRGLLSTEAK